MTCQARRQLVMVAPWLSFSAFFTQVIVRCLAGRLVPPLVGGGKGVLVAGGAARALRVRRRLLRGTRRPGSFLLLLVDHPVQRLAAEGVTVVAPRARSSRIPKAMTGWLIMETPVGDSGMVHPLVP